MNTSSPARWSRAATVLATALVVVVVAATVSVRSHDAVGVRATPAPGRTLALGDSYSAGTGVTSAVGPDPTCARSERAFASLLPGTVAADREIVACAGATIADVLGDAASYSTPSDAESAPQLDRVDRDASLITLTIGGNDLDFGPALRFCATRFRCDAEPYDGAPSLSAWIGETLPRIRADLEVLYARIRDIAPLARIVVLGYPSLFPGGELETPGTLSACGIVSLAYDDEERNAIRRWGAALNVAIKTEAVDAGLTYLGLDDVFEGHEVCAGSEAWIAPVVLDPGLAAASFHPTADGHEAIARAVASLLRA